MTLYEILSLLLELSVLVVLLVEYFWGIPDLVIKNEAKRRKKAREKYHFDQLTDGEGK